MLMKFSVGELSSFSSFLDFVKTRWCTKAQLSRSFVYSTNTGCLFGMRFNFVIFMVIINIFNNYFCGSYNYVTLSVNIERTKQEFRFFYFLLPGGFYNVTIYFMFG